jgi:hypothetical protein
MAFPSIILGPLVGIGEDPAVVVSKGTSVKDSSIVVVEPDSTSCSEEKRLLGLTVLKEEPEIDELVLKLPRRTLALRR